LLILLAWYRNTGTTGTSPHPERPEHPASRRTTGTCDRNRGRCYCRTLLDACLVSLKLRNFFLNFISAGPSTRRATPCPRPQRGEPGTLLCARSTLDASRRLLEILKLKKPEASRRLCLKKLAGFLLGEPLSRLSFARKAPQGNPQGSPNGGAEPPHAWCGSRATAGERPTRSSRDFYRVKVR